MKSIVTQIDGYCYVCGRPATEMHHIYPGNPGRKNSEKYGLKIPLCHNCHNEPPNGIHFNAALDLEIKKVGQIIFEREYPDKDFVEIFGKNYRG